MTARDFVFWLQGTLELGKVTKLDEDQVKILREHLDLVFRHDISPPAPGTEDAPKVAADVPDPPSGDELKRKLDALHDQGRAFARSVRFC